MSNGHNTLGDELAPRRFGNRDACDPLIDNAPDVEEPFGVGLSDLGHLRPTSPFLAHCGISKFPSRVHARRRSTRMRNIAFGVYFRGRRSSLWHESSEIRADDN